MKKLIVAVLIMFIGTTAFSQGIDIGIKGGANFSNIRDLKNLGLQAKTGFHAGVFVGMKFSSRFGIQADVLYSQQGAKFRENGDFDLNYITLPVVLKYYVVDDQGLNLQIGPEFGFLVDGNLRAVVGGIEKKVDANDSDIAGIIGLGYDFPSGVRIEGRYHLGFREVSADPQANGKNKYISVGLGYSFL